MTPFSISGEDRERLSYVLVNRVRELQSYKPRIEELQDRLANPITCHNLMRALEPFNDFDVYEIVISTFLLFRSFDTNGNLVSTGNMSSGDEEFSINQWKIILESFFEFTRIRCDPATVEMVQAFDTTGPMSDELIEVLDRDWRTKHFFNAKIMLGKLRAKKAAWTLEIEGLRRELDHMGDKMLALITDLSLNR